jgi:hypothetical protein
MVLVAILLLALGSSQSVRASASPVWAHPAGAQPALGPMGAQGSQASPSYDEQLGMTFSQDFTKLAYNVTAIAQSDAQGYGPGYLLNGLTNEGYWYQVGIAYDWPYQTGGYDPGFNFLYETFNSSGASIFPSAGGGGLSPFSGSINSGDKVLLQLSFSEGQVVFFAHDWNTGTTASETFAAVGSRFDGLRFSSGAHGFFTGLMTEWYHTNPYYGGEGEVVYSNPSTQLVSAVLWADEFNANGSTSVFGDQQSYTFSNPTQLHIFSLDGATEYANAYEFITGVQGRTLVTLSYSVSGGGSGYSAPLLSYFQSGKEQTAQLTGNPTSFIADNGSFWQVSSTLPGGSGTERWATAQQTNGTLTAPLSVSILYFHQYLVTFSYGVQGGGSGYSAPHVQSLEFGAGVMLNGGDSAWVDARSTFAYPSVLPGSTSTERWASLNYAGTVSQAGSIAVTYYHQVALTLGYSLVGGGTAVGPTLDGTQFGIAYSASVSNSTSYFLDQGTNWSVTAMLAGSDIQERWVTSQTTDGNLTAPESIGLAYQHQYALTSNAIPSSGGTINVPSSWVDEGTTIQISEAPSQGWKFEGWTGNGGYSGLLNATSFIVTGPIQENATFYPGLTLEAGPNGVATYTWAGGNGTVLAGGTTVIYVPQGATVKLRAAPSSALYSFVGWRPSESSAGATISFSVDSPQTVSASFSLSDLSLAGAVSVIVAVVVAVALIARRSRLGRAPAFNPAPSAP